MKVIIAILNLITCFLYSQPSNCRNFRNGVFKLSWAGHSVIIKRQGEIQQEFLDGSTTPATFKVKWSNDCTYILTPQEDVFKQHPNYPKNTIITVRITKAILNSYVQTSSANFTNKSFTSEVIKIN